MKTTEKDKGDHSFLTNVRKFQGLNPLLVLFYLKNKILKHDQIFLHYSKGKC